MIADRSSMKSDEQPHGAGGSGAASTGQPVERRVRLSDGTEVFYRAWPPGAAAPGGAAPPPRGPGPLGRLAGPLRSLGLTDTAIFAWDARGHGQSPGDRGYAPSFARIVRDLDEFV